MAAVEFRLESFSGNNRADRIAKVENYQPLHDLVLYFTAPYTIIICLKLTFVACALCPFTIIITPLTERHRPKPIIIYNI